MNMQNKRVKKYKIGICGHFSFKKELFNGQTIKTKMLTEVLESSLGKSLLLKIDTHGGVKALPRILFFLIKAFRKCESLIMLPAQNGVKVFAPIFIALNKIFCCRIHYVIIGGWLPEMIKHKKWLAFFLKKFDGIYVETFSMKTALEEQGFTNVFVMPNFKDLSILREEELVYNTQEPFAFCTFSRVMKEKGIEDAINAITELNTQASHTIATLDIYGTIDKDYVKTFERLQKQFPSYICYRGIVQPKKSVQVLKEYFALLFPTHFNTEGIPGTIIDSYAAGVPVITALWNNYRDIFIENETGYGFKIGDVKQFLFVIKNAIQNPSHFNTMKSTCLREARKYTSKEAVKILLQQLER